MSQSNPTNNSPVVLGHPLPDWMSPPTKDNYQHWMSELDSYHEGYIYGFLECEYDNPYILSEGEADWEAWRQGWWEGKHNVDRSDGGRE